MNGFILAGKLLNYPECCIKYFCENFAFGPVTVSYNGFIPCIEHSKLTREELETLIGRSLEKEPEVFTKWMTALIALPEGADPLDKFKTGLAIYAEAGLDEFWTAAWLRAVDLSEEEEEIQERSIAHAEVMANC
jgi:hypothetical protein